MLYKLCYRWLNRELHLCISRERVGECYTACGHQMCTCSLTFPNFLKFSQELVSMVIENNKWTRSIFCTHSIGRISFHWEYSGRYDTGCRFLYKNCLIEPASRHYKYFISSVQPRCGYDIPLCALQLSIEKPKKQSKRTNSHYSTWKWPP